MNQPIGYAVIDNFGRMTPTGGTVPLARAEEVLACQRLYYRQTGPHRIVEVREYDKFAEDKAPA